MKKDSLSVIREIVSSSHRVVMITGDNPLTACHVAKVLKFTKKETTLILTQVDNDWIWQSVNQDLELPLIPTDFRRFTSDHILCVTGLGLNHLQSLNKKFYQQILPHIRIFARVNPKQKELIVTSLNDLGYTTLMCGDGTNDVGALKHAHVGMSSLIKQSLSTFNNLSFQILFTIYFRSCYSVTSTRIHVEIQKAGREDER